MTQLFSSPQTHVSTKDRKRSLYDKGLYIFLTTVLILLILTAGCSYTSRMCHQNDTESTAGPWQSPQEILQPSRVTGLGIPGAPSTRLLHRRSC